MQAHELIGARAGNAFDQLCVPRVVELEPAVVVLACCTTNYEEVTGRRKSRDDICGKQKRLAAL